MSKVAYILRSLSTLVFYANASDNQFASVIGRFAILICIDIFSRKILKLAFQVISISNIDYHVVETKASRRSLITKGTLNRSQIRAFFSYGRRDRTKANSR